MQQVTDYNTYTLSTAEWLKYFLIASGVIFVFAYVFYRSYIMFFVLLPVAVYFPFYKKKDLLVARKRKLSVQFKEGIQTLSASLSSGYSMENALKESVRELELLYGKDAMIVHEFSYISHLVNMNTPIEKALDMFAVRSGLDDIRNFARVVRIAKRSAGDIVPIINHTAGIINDKILIKEEILTMTASKRFEQSVMNFMPLLIVLYIDTTSKGFFDMMYSTAIGRIVMTVCLLIYVGAVLISQKILDIEV